MTLQQPQRSQKRDLPREIYCHKCDNPVKFDEDHIAASGRKIPLEPNTNGEPHVKYCMYADLKWNPHTEALFTDFISLMPRKKRGIGAVGRAK